MVITDKMVKTASLTSMRRDGGRSGRAALRARSDPSTRVTRAINLMASGGVAVAWASARTALAAAGVRAAVGVKTAACCQPWRTHRRGINGGVSRQAAAARAARSISISNAA